MTTKPSLAEGTQAPRVPNTSVYRPEGAFKAVICCQPGQEHPRNPAWGPSSTARFLRARGSQMIKAFQHSEVFLKTHQLSGCTSLCLLKLVHRLLHASSPRNGGNVRSGKEGHATGNGSKTSDDAQMLPKRSHFHYSRPARARSTVTSPWLCSYPRQAASLRLLPSTVPAFLFKAAIALVLRAERPRGAADMHKADESDPVVRAREQPNYEPGAPQHRTAIASGIRAFAIQEDPWHSAGRSSYALWILISM